MIKKTYFIFAFVSFVLFISCSISYKFNGASIDYSKIKTISVLDFPNQAPLVYPSLSQDLTEGIKDMYIKQTKLKCINSDGDLQIEGEIVGYDLTPMSAQKDGYASETKLTLTVNVRFTNTKNQEENFESNYSAYRTFETTSSLDDVQEDLVKEMIDEIADQIFNNTVANW